MSLLLNDTQYVESTSFNFSEIVFNLRRSNDTFNTSSFPKPKSGFFNKLLTGLFVTASLCSPPSSWDLTYNKTWPPVYSQGGIGSCTAQVVGGVYMYNLYNKNAEVSVPDHTPGISRLGLYYDTRVGRGTPTEDSGATIEDAMKVITKKGSCDERLWPYIPSRINEPPSTACNNDAPNHLATQYRQVPQTLLDIQCSIYQGHPVMFGMLMYSGLKSVSRTQTMLPPPSPSQKRIGGHAMIIVGFDDNKQAFKVRSSWGVVFAQNGHMWVPYSYILDKEQSFDFWVMSRVRNFDNVTKISYTRNGSHRNVYGYTYILVLAVLVCLI